jgi:predicted Zn-dependent protease
MAKFPYDSASWRTKDVVDVAIADKYGNFADSAVQAGDFARALEAADLGIRFGPDLTWIRMNRAHALMFLDRVGEARAEYLARRGKEIPGHGTWERVVIEEFAQLRERGREHPLMAKIEKLFQAAPGTR